VHQETKQKAIDELKEQIDGTITHKRRAETLLKGLSAEKQKWVVCTRMLSGKYDTVQGDVLIAAAFITMGGAFTQKYRLKLVSKWQESLNQVGLACNDTFNFQELYGDNGKIREWHANSLPPDTFSTDNALIMEKTKRYCLLVDPQQLAWTWLKKQQNAREKGMLVTKMTDPNFRRMLEMAIDQGLLVLVENLGEDIDVHIESLVRREITKYGNQKMIKFCRRPLKYDEGFRMLMVTNLSRPHYADNITNHVATVNFFVTIEGLTQNLLSLVVANERSDLEASFNENTKATFENIKLLKVTEEKILENLSTNVEKILASEKLIDILKESKTCAETVADKLKKINSTNQFLLKSRQMYAPVAVRAAHLYFAVTELAQVNQMYQYSLKWFLNVFNQTLKKTNILTQETAVVIDEEEFKLLNSKFSPDDRISMLIKTFTQELIRKIVFSAFQEDRQLLTYYIAMKVLQAEELMDQELLHFSLSGSKKINQDVVSPGPKIGVPWITDLMWAELHYLNNVKPFNEDVLTNHILQNPEQWSKLFDLDAISFSEIPCKGLLDIRSLHEEHVAVPPTRLSRSTATKPRLDTGQALMRASGTKGGESHLQLPGEAPGKKESRSALRESADGRQIRTKPAEPLRRDGAGHASDANLMLGEQEPSVQDGRRSRGSYRSERDEGTRAG
jgi:dynein heavy chain